MKILMVCLGNICRSPMAEGIMQQKAASVSLDWEIDSAGTNGNQTGEPPHPLSQKVAWKHGIDISSQKATPFSATDFDYYDKIYAMANDVLEEMKHIAGDKYDASKVDLLLNELYPGNNLDVPDPWYGPEAGYYKVFEMISKASDSIINKYKNSVMPNTIT